jgi:hypothetical protein
MVDYSTYGYLSFPGEHYSYSYFLYSWDIVQLVVVYCPGSNDCWLGGKSKKRAIYSPMVFAFAPQLINILRFIPGLTIPLSLSQVWTVGVSYQIIRATYGFS